MLNEEFFPPTQLQTSVLFLVFNRPDATRVVFEAIRKAKPPRLYIAADGARLNIDGEAERVELVRNICLAIDWPCEVNTLFRGENLGCKLAVSSGIDWFFEYEEQGIILEDDCLPSQSFFWYCEELLNKFSVDSRIFHIDGSNFAAKSDQIDSGYFFSRYALIWGWATWRRAWKFYKLELPSLAEIKSKRLLKSYFGSNQAEKYWIKNLELVRGGFDTWDYQWFYTLWSQNGLVIRPNVNLVKNIGFDSNATHTKFSPYYGDKMQLNECKIPLAHPKIIAADFANDEECSKMRFGIRKSFSTRLFHKMHRMFK